MYGALYFSKVVHKPWVETHFGVMESASVEGAIAAAWIGSKRVSQLRLQEMDSRIRDARDL